MILRVQPLFFWFTGDYLSKSNALVRWRTIEVQDNLPGLGGQKSQNVTR